MPKSLYIYLNLRERERERERERCLCDALAVFAVFSPFGAYCLFDMSLAIGRLSCSVCACLPLTNAKLSGV